MKIEVTSENAMKAFGAAIGARCIGGEVIELVGDVGAGKTTLAKGIATGLSVEEDVQSPSFTISRVYEARDNLRMVHYDFYRLTDAGIMRDELSETMSDPQNITIIEWSGIVDGVLPIDRVTINIQSPTETSRHVEIAGSGDKSNRLVTGL